VTPTKEEVKDYLKEHDLCVIDASYHKWRWRALGTWVILFTALTVYALYQNTARVDDIQSARRESCERTYQAIQLIFMPFFPEKLTKEQQRQLDPAALQQYKDGQARTVQFENSIDGLVRKCATQVQSDG
jgi:hypothetical protein